jgi:hypothetical protein
MMETSVPHRLALRVGLFLALALAPLAVTSPARAEAKAEATAKGLETKAMQEDYLSTDFDKALEKLTKASSTCGADKCSSLVRAQIKRDVGVVQIAGKQSHDAGVAVFVEALKIDGAVTLDPDTKTKEIETAWAEAKKQAGAGAAPTGTPAAGDFSVQPVPEQQVRTPVPVYAEYSGTEELAKVVLKYKAFGMSEWKTLEMHKVEKGWGAEVPCPDVQQGDLVYYVQGFNAANDPVATSGDRNSPYKTAVKREPLAGEAPHFPGKEPSKQCADAGDCPPDFPGCKKGAAEASTEGVTLRSEGEDCDEDSQCESSTCKDSKCTAPSSRKRPKFWIGVAGQLDFVSLPSANDVCVLAGNATPQNSAGYYCTNSDGSDYPTRPPQDKNGTQNQRIVPGVSDKVQGGLARGNIRAMVTFDFAPTANLMLGVRLGYVLNTYPGTAASNDGKTFAPVHLEARVAYVFGKDALAKAGLAPYVFVAGGVAEWDAQVSVTVVETGANGAKSVQAWNTAGPGFVSLGGGLRYAFTPRFAALFGPRLNAAFGGTGTVLSASPELSLQYGF